MSFIIKNTDCLSDDGMKTIEDKTIDLIICDLPYGVLNKNKCTWDNKLPLDKLWEQYNRIIKNNGAIILFSQGMFTAELMMSNIEMWRYNLIWDKCRTTGFLNAKRMPLRAHEDICVFYKKQPIYNPQMELVSDKEKSHSRGKGTNNLTNNCYGKFDFKEYTPNNLKFPKSIIKIPKEHSKEVWHPTQKPVKLLEYLIKTYSNEGDLILDNCMGSGTTAIAAINTNRNFIGYEINTEYFTKIIERIEVNL